MNYRMIGFAIGRILLVEALLLLLPLAVALGYGEAVRPDLIPMALLVLCGGLLSFKKPQQTALYARDGLCSGGHWPGWPVVASSALCPL